MKTQQNELDKASKALSDAESLIRDLENRVSEKDNTIIELHSLREKDQENNKSRVDELNHALNVNNQELQKRDEKLHHMTEELDSLKGDLEKYKLSTEEMEKYLEQVQRMNANEVERIHKEHQQELQAVNSKHVAELEDLKLLTEKLDKSGQKMEKRRQAYDSEVHDLKESLGEQTKVNKDLEQQIASLNEEYDDVVACLTETDATLERVQFGLKEQEASRVNEISLLENDLKKKSAEIAELQDKMAREEEKSLSIRNKLVSLGEELEHKNMQLEEAGQELEEWKQVYDSEVHELKESLGEQITAKKILEQQLATLKQQYDNVVTCLTETDATLERVQFGLKEQEASHVNEISLLRSELKSKGEQIADLEEKIASEEEQNLKITNKLTEERKKLVNEHESLVGAHNVLEQKIASLYENLSAVTDERDSLFNEVELLRNTHKVIEQNMDLLEKSICPVSNKFKGESLVEDSMERLEVRQSAGFTEGTVLWVKGRVHLQLNVSSLARTNILKTLACKKTKSKLRTASTSS